MHNWVTDSFSEEQWDVFFEDARAMSIVKLKLKYGIKDREFNKLKLDNSFLERLNSAREEGLEDLADKLLEIPDEYEDNFKARLKSDNIKWMLSKRKSKVYGDRLQVDVQHVDLTGALNEAKARLIDVTPISLKLNASNNTINNSLNTDIKSVDEFKTVPCQEDDDIFS